MFLVGLFLIARNSKQSNFPSTGELIVRMWYIYTMKSYSIIKENEIMKFERK